MSSKSETPLRLSEYLAGFGISMSAESEPSYMAAVTHPSRTDDTGEPNYQRLEFIGDAVLEFVSTSLIDKANPDLPEGYLTKIRASIVQSSSLAEYARGAGIDSLVLVGASLANDDISKSDHVLEDVFEALIGAVYKNEGIAKATEYVSSFISKDVRFDEPEDAEDAKSKLQAYAQKHLGAVCGSGIEYETFQSADLGNGRVEFTSIVRICGNEFGRGVGSSKKKAEKSAAKIAMSEIERNRA